LVHLDGTDILRRVQTSFATVLSYEPLSVEIALSGALAPDPPGPPGPPGPVCDISVRVRDTRNGEVLVFRSDDWPLGRMPDDPDPDGKIRDSFAWLLHVHLDEWWDTEIRRP